MYKDLSLDIQDQTRYRETSAGQGTTSTASNLLPENYVD